VVLYALAVSAHVGSGVGWGKPDHHELLANPTFRGVDPVGVRISMFLRKRVSPFGMAAINSEMAATNITNYVKSSEAVLQDCQ